MTFWPATSGPQISNDTISTRLHEAVFDENLSPALARRLADAYPGSIHCGAVASPSATDKFLWAYAAANGFVLVSKDRDFERLASLDGSPSIVIVLSPNSGTAAIEAAFRASRGAIEEFFGRRGPRLYRLRVGGTG